MKQRLRNERRFGEFDQDCFEIAFRLDPTLNTDEIDAVTDEFISIMR